MLLIDTNVIIDFIKGDKNISKLFRNVFPNQQIAYSVLTKYEFEINARNRELKIITKLFNNFWSALAIDADTVAQAVKYYQKYHKSHYNIDAFDYLIAATAKTKNAILVTNNIKHFPMNDIKKKKPDEDLTPLAKYL